MIDTLNKFVVGIRGETVVIGRPANELTKADALLLAAYLVAMAEDNEGEFAEVLEAVRGALCP